MLLTELAKRGNMSGSGDGTGRQHFCCTLDDCKMVDVEVNVVIAVIVALLKDEEEQKKTKEKARHIVAEKEKPERGISDN